MKKNHREIIIYYYDCCANKKSRMQWIKLSSPTRHAYEQQFFSPSLPLATPSPWWHYQFSIHPAPRVARCTQVSILFLFSFSTSIGKYANINKGERRWWQRKEGRRRKKNLFHPFSDALVTLLAPLNIYLAARLSSVGILHYKYAVGWRIQPHSWHESVNFLKNRIE